MAVIGSIRKHSTLLLVVVAVALLAFLVGDGFFGRRGQGNNLYEKYITVGKDNISQLVYSTKYEGYRDMYKREGQTLSSEDDFRVGLQVYDELVDSVILARQAGYLGITVTAEELRDLVAGPQPHPLALRFFAGGDPANYNMAGVQNFIDNLEHMAQSPDSVWVIQYLTYVEPTVEKETYRDKYFNLLSGAYYLPKAFAQKTADEASMKANLEVIQIPYTSELASDDKISFTEEEVKKCYEENKYRFKQDEEFRNVEYVLFPVEPSEKDLKTIEDSVQRMFEGFTETDRPDYFINRLVDNRYDSTYYKRGMLEPAIDTLLFDAPEGAFLVPYIDGDYWKFAKLLSAKVRPDSINVSPMFIRWSGTEQNPRKKEESQLIADSAYLAVMAGVDFFEVVEKYSDIPYTQFWDSGKIWMADGFSEGLFDNDQHVFDTMYSFNTGIIVKRELPAGIMILKLNEKTEAERKIQVAAVKQQIMASSETRGSIESAASNFVNGTDTYQKFADAVVAHNLDKRTNDRVTKMSYTLPGIREGGREVIRWIFNEDTKKGAVSHVFKLEDLYVVAVLKDIYPQGYMSLEQEQVRNYIESLVKRDKKAEILEKVFTEQIANYKTLNAISEKNEIELNTLNISFADRNFGYYGPETKIIGKIFGQASTGKIEIMRGDMGVYAIKIAKIDVPTPDAASTNSDNISMMTQQNKMMYQSRISNNGAQLLRKMYKIKDNRLQVETNTNR